MKADEAVDFVKTLDSAEAIAKATEGDERKTVQDAAEAQLAKLGEQGDTDAPTYDDGSTTPDAPEPVDGYVREVDEKVAAREKETVRPEGERYVTPRHNAQAGNDAEWSTPGKGE
jgi:hypothetical protein